MATLGSIVLHVEKESVQDNANISQHPVETGIKLSDHVERLPKGLSISGKIIRDTEEEAKTVVQSIRRSKNRGEVFLYRGRVIAYDMSISDFTYEADANIANGYNFSMTLKEIRIAGDSYTTEEKSAKEETVSGQKQVVNQKNEQYHTIKKGDTLWDLAPKYGTTWQKLQELNNIDPTKLKVGQKIRVK